MALTREDIAALMKGIAPVIRDVLDLETARLNDRIKMLEDRVKQLEPAPSDDDARNAIEGGRQW